MSQGGRLSCSQEAPWALRSQPPSGLCPACFVHAVSRIGWCPLTMGGKDFIGSPCVGQRGW